MKDKYPLEYLWIRANKNWLATLPIWRYRQFQKVLLSLIEK